MSLKICIPAIAAFLLVACGGDGNKASDPEPSAEADFVVDTFDDLSVCVDKREGATAYVKDEEKDYICTDGDWTIDTNADTRKKSSSSSAKSSSSKRLDPSMIFGTPCKTETEDNCEYGELVDARDGQTYKTVKIGGQVWMAENLNHKVDSSFCYNDSVEYCEKYGRLYMWAAAVGKPEEECGFGNKCELSDNVRGVCPEGWHLPDTTEWRTLFFLGVGGNEHKVYNELRSQTGWVSADGNGTDSYGFSALPAGDRNENGRFSMDGYSTVFWSAADSYGGFDAYFMGLVGYAQQSYTGKRNAFSVRCLRDEVIFSDGSAGEKNSSSSLNGFDWSIPKENYLNPEITYGTMTDSRDGQTYKTVKIGDQVWMAENLNYYDSTFDGRSWCFGAENSAITPKCAVMGRFYTWAGAIKSCPSGWHLPSRKEWEPLVGGPNGYGDSEILKSRTAWLYGGNGTDSTGFSALPAGYRDNDGNFNLEGCVADFWSATSDSNDAISVQLHCKLDHVILGSSDKNPGLSVRCIQD